MYANAIQSMKIAQIKILNNREEIEAFARAFAETPDFKALYRANVNPAVTELELSIMDIRYLRRACSLAIWTNNYRGIVLKSKKRESFLRAIICEICGISRTALWYIIKSAKARESA